MAIRLISSTILHPSPSSDPSICFDTKIPLTIFDKAAFDLNVSVLYAFRPPMPSNEAMKEGLLKALVNFPHLAGRFTTDELGRPCIHLNNAGIRVIETYIPTTLAEKLPFNPSTDIEDLFPPIEGIDELLQIQLNRYACGGVVIGQTCHHHVADGQSMSSFFFAWAKLVRGLDTHDIILPYHDRASISVPRNPLNVEYDHRSIEFRKSTNLEKVKSSTSIENLVVNFSVDFMNKLKMKVNEEDHNSNGTRPYQIYSTFECLLAHVWKKVTQARGLEPDECSQVRVAVNGRARIKPPVPMEYFGNLVLWAYPRLKVKELLQENHAYIAKAIHEEVTRVDNRYFKSFIDFGEMSKDDGGEELVSMAADIGNLLCPNLEVDSWMRFQFHNMDFGGGSPCAVLPAELPVEGLVIFVPSCKEGGGVDVVMALLHEHVQIFKQICHTF
ncbi:Transferase [Macleaya cordata]|uniref:Transferase n=1 Tax=Macleaya cordata TaxID=56857 RepID=A0A200PYR7_MACCD|nr:Transferase [Macleaya cordata]